MLQSHPRKQHLRVNPDSRWERKGGSQTVRPPVEVLDAVGLKSIIFAIDLTDSKLVVYSKGITVRSEKWSKKKSIKAVY